MRIAYRRTGSDGTLVAGLMSSIGEQIEVAGPTSVSPLDSEHGLRRFDLRLFPVQRRLRMVDAPVKPAGGTSGNP